MPDAPLVLPFDEHNQRLVDHVHPADWANPQPAPVYHLVVVGAGTAGLIAAAGAAGLGARVAIVERHLMGGDCLNYGCVPSKALIRAARAWKEVAQSRDFGAPATTDGGDFVLAMRRVRRLRSEISAHDSAARFRDLGVDVFFGQGRFVAADALEVEGARLRFRRAVIATGGHPAVPSIPGLVENGYLTHESIFGLTELPRRLAVLGGGPIGCELAQAFARFGSDVALLHRRGQLLPREDANAAGAVQEALERDGVRIFLAAQLREVTRRGRFRVLAFDAGHGRQEAVCDEILVAAGRTPNLEGLGLEAAMVEADAQGIKVDDQMRTSNRRIFAAGDVASRFRFTHAADAQARLVIENALFGRRRRASELVIPWCTFTSPELAHVGLNEAEAAVRRLRIETLTIPLAEVDRALLDGAGEGFLCVHLKKGSDRILGATLVSEHAGESIGELALAITAGVGLAAIGRTIHPYPTQAEVIRKAADAWRRRKLTPRAKWLWRWYFRRQERRELKRLAREARTVPDS